MNFTNLRKQATSRSMTNSQVKSLVNKYGVPDISSDNTNSIIKSDFQGNDGTRSFMSNFGIKSRSGGVNFSYHRKGDGDESYPAQASIEDGKSYIAIPRTNSEPGNVLVVLYDKIIINIAKNLISIIESEKVFSEIVLMDIHEWNRSNYKVEKNHHFFIFLPHLLTQEVPYDRSFIYLMEQNLDGQLNARYLDAMSNNIIFKQLLEQSTIFDYSECNINVWKKHVKPEISQNIKLFLPTVSKKIDMATNKEYDVLFFGALNPRRERIINTLKELNINIKIINYDKWGDDLINEIKKAKIVLNIHYYDNAILETPRISEVLPYAKIISEIPCNEDNSSYERYKDVVDFVPIVSTIGDITSLTERITDTLNIGDKDRMRHRLSVIKHIKTINRGGTLLDCIQRYKSAKDYHRYLCNSLLSLIRIIPIPKFGITPEYETVLIEFRKFSHLEFLLRNTIIKFPSWSHTVVCGNLNEDFIRKMCTDICKDNESSIKIVKLDIDNLTPSDYSSLLSTKNFWENFTGEKLLVYQEDTMLFHNKITPFLQYDYVGAPWPPNQNDNSYGVGNGGFSLRSKSKMLECIDKVNIAEIERLRLGQSTVNYMKNTNSYVVPEDVYFSKVMIDHGIGIVANRDVALRFSQETQKGINPLGGHNYWLAETVTDTKLQHDTVGIITPFLYIVGGGEYYLSMVIRFFIMIGAKRIHFYNNTEPNMFTTTLKKFFNDTEIDVIEQRNIPRFKVNNCAYDYFVEMGNELHPRFRNNFNSKKYIYHCQFPFDYYRTAGRIKLDNIDHVIVNSEYTLKYYNNKTQLSDANKVCINYPSCFKSLDTTKFNKRKNTFVMIGRIHIPSKHAHNKGHETVLKIFHALANTSNDFELCIIGTVQDVSYYNYLRKYEYEGKIRVIGDCSEEEKNNIIAESEYVIHATGIDMNEEKVCFAFEHFGISPIECINKNCIPICTNGGYFPHYIKHGENGFLFRTTYQLKQLLGGIVDGTNKLESEKAIAINKDIIKKFSHSCFNERLAHILLKDLEQ